ncbi:hypothetical protein HDU99_005816, partial [Rhizoclosmatium hyalinum]
MLTNAAPAKTGPRLAGPRPPRPNRYLDEGVGRKTGWRPPKDNDDFDEWLVFEGEGEGEGESGGGGGGGGKNAGPVPVPVAVYHEPASPELAASPRVKQSDFDASAVFRKSTKVPRSPIIS